MGGAPARTLGRSSRTWADDRGALSAQLLSLIAAALAGGLVAAIGAGFLVAALDKDPAPPAAPEVLPADWARTATEIAAPSVVTIISGKELWDPETGYATSAPIQGGSGVIVSEDGYIVTNNHVVTENDLTTPVDEVLVKLGAEYVTARIVGRDMSSDIAVIKVDRDGLDPIEFGSSGDLRPGDPVIAIGDPHGVGLSVSQGIVSATGRTFGTEMIEWDDSPYLSVDALASALQVDALINHGNSGGALVNSRGQYVGIPSAGLGDWGWQGLNFCIPSDLAKGIIEDLIEFGRAFHPYLGAWCSTIDIAEGDFYELPTDHGALVEEVDPGSPAEEAGLIPTDIIVTIDGEPIMTQLELVGTVRTSEIGQTIAVEFWRLDFDDYEHELMEVEITLGEEVGIR